MQLISWGLRSGEAEQRALVGPSQGQIDILQGTRFQCGRLPALDQSGENVWCQAWQPRLLTQPGPAPPMVGGQ